MSQDIFYSLLISSAFLGLFVISEVLYYNFKVKVEVTRKLVHFATGILSLLFPVVLSSHWYVLSLCATFLVILLVSLKFNWLKSINAIDRKSYGSVCYPFAVYGCFLIHSWYGQQSNFYGEYLIYYLPLLILAISDPLAALIGKRWAWIPFKVGKGTKTMAGSLTFFVSALVISVAAFSIFQTELPSYLVLISCLIVALVTTFSEAVSRNGFDNLFIPLVGASAVYVCLVSFTSLG